jgi:release factor glutamine methyltransferase
MKLNEFYRHFLLQLRLIYVENEASNITKMVFESLANISRSDVLRNPELEIEHDTFLSLNQALDQLLNHQPIQYILGEAWFYHLKFKVSDAVLIPRPETEELVEIAIQHVKKSNQKNVLDIGTGSGCIPISIKKNVPEINITSIDLSAKAIEIASENANNLQTKINFKTTDFLDENNWENLEVFDVIISNPPYIPNVEIQSMDKHVTEYEPHLALFVPDNDPLIFYKAILKFAQNHLNENGNIFLETHENFAEEVCCLFKDAGYKATVKNDLFEKPRMVLINRFH